jgi:hypothetical protein
MPMIEENMASRSRRVRSRAPARKSMALLRRGGHGGLVHAGRMVCGAQEAVVESPGRAVWPGVDGALHHDGGGRVAGVEAGRIRGATPAADALPPATGAQRRVAFAEIALLWLAIAAPIAAFRPVSRSAAWRLAPYLAWGNLRRCAKLDTVAIELLSAVSPG